MLLHMIESKDLHYPGELVDVPEPQAKDWIARGYARPVLCPECGSGLEDAGCAVHCRNCGYRRWKK